MSEEQEQHRPRRHLPGVRLVDSQAGTGSRVRALLERIIHRDADGHVRLNERAPEIKAIMDDANALDVDVVLKPTGTNTSAVMGEGIADHRHFIELGVAAGLGAVALLGIGGIILRRRHRE